MKTDTQIKELRAIQSDTLQALIILLDDQMIPSEHKTGFDYAIEVIKRASNSELDTYRDYKL